MPLPTRRPTRGVRPLRNRPAPLAARFFLWARGAAVLFAAAWASGCSPWLENFAKPSEEEVAQAQTAAQVQSILKAGSPLFVFQDPKRPDIPPSFALLYAEPSSAAALGETERTALQSARVVLAEPGFASPLALGAGDFDLDSRPAVQSALGAVWGKDGENSLKAEIKDKALADAVEKEIARLERAEADESNATGATDADPTGGPALAKASLQGSTGFAASIRSMRPWAASLALSSALGREGLDRPGPGMPRLLAQAANELNIPLKPLGDPAPCAQAWAELNRSDAEGALRYATRNAKRLRATARAADGYAQAGDAWGLASILNHGKGMLYAEVEGAQRRDAGKSALACRQSQAEALAREFGQGGAFVAIDAAAAAGFEDAPGLLGELLSRGWEPRPAAWRAPSAAAPQKDNSARGEKSEGQETGTGAGTGKETGTGK